MFKLMDKKILTIVQPHILFIWRPEYAQGTQADQNHP